MTACRILILLAFVSLASVGCSDPDTAPTTDAGPLDGGSCVNEIGTVVFPSQSCQCPTGVNGVIECTDAGTGVCVCDTFEDAGVIEDGGDTGAADTGAADTGADDGDGGMG